MASRISVWVVRVGWAALPLIVGPTLAAALDPTSGPVRTVASLGLWSAWAGVLLSTLVPHPVGLSALRVGAPGAPAALVAAAMSGHPSPLGLAWTATVTIVALSYEVAFAFVNGAAYPNERRYPLRVPGALLVGLLPAAWALAATGVVAGPLLLAARQWIAGGLALVVGIPVAWLLIRAIHRLSWRWVVFVPAGLVLHDPLTCDPVLFPRRLVRALHPAPAGADGDDSYLDLTQGAPGLALALALTENVPLAVVAPGKRLGTTTSSARLLFTPGRPGAVMAEARARRFPVTT